MTDFILNHVYDDAPIDNYTPSFRRKVDAATRAMTAALQYFMFESDNDDVKTLFVQELEKKVYKEGDVICREGDRGEEMYVLEQGQIDVYVGELKVGNLNVGSVFGELSLIYGTARTATCKCAPGPDIIVYVLSKIPFRRIQATIAMAQIEVSMSQFHKQISTMSEEQETASWIPAEVKLEDISTHCVLGQGTFGQVTLVTASNRPNESFAMKRMSKKSIVESQVSSSCSSSSSVGLGRDGVSVCVFQIFLTNQMKIELKMNRSRSFPELNCSFPIGCPLHVARAPRDPRKKRPPGHKVSLHNPPPRHLPG